VIMVEAPPAIVPSKKGQSGSSKKKRWTVQLQALAHERKHWSVSDMTTARIGLFCFFFLPS
jgi:hypothetical protein